MLERLKEYALRHELVAEPGFAPKSARWGIECGSRRASVVELEDTSGKKKGYAFPCCPDLSQGELKRGGTGCRHFLLDTVDVVVRISDPDDEKLLAKHRYFVDLLRRASASVPELEAVVRCLDDEERLDELRRHLTTLKAKPTENVTFSIGDEYLVESDAWHDWWRECRASIVAGDSSRKKSGKAGPMRCFLTGQIVEPALTHPKVSGLADVGGQSAGDVLASFKQSSFRSYGLVQSANAAMSEEAAALYRAALNDLLAHHSRRFGVVKIVHWYKVPVPPDEDPIHRLETGDPRKERRAQRQASRLLASIDEGEAPPKLRDNYFYALTLSGAAGRIMVHDWMEGQFNELVEAVDFWFDSLEVIRRDGSGPAPAPKFMAVLGALVRDLKDLKTPTVNAMWRVALDKNAAVPPALLAQALARLRIDIVKNDPVKHACIGLVKAYHVRQGDQHMKPGLNEDHPAAAYQCGRLMALFANLQYSALGDVGAGVVQRYYAAASATPSLVLGRLTRGAQFHLDKLETGLRRWYDLRIADVMRRIVEFPATLDLHGQSLFALGYYHQIADRPSKKNDSTNDE